MAIQTGAGWFFVVLLIHSSLIISDVEHLFMCFQEKKEKKTVFVTWGDVLRLIYWRSTLFWIVFLFFFFFVCLPTPGHRLRASVLYSSAAAAKSGLGNFKGPYAPVFNLLLQEMSIRRRTSSRFTQVAGATGALAKVQFLGCRLQWTVHGSGLMTSSPKSCTPREIPSPPQTALRKVLWYSGGATARKVSAGGNHPHQEA